MFAGSIQMIFFSVLTCTIGSQSNSNRMVAANPFWRHFLKAIKARSSIFFFEISEFYHSQHTDISVRGGKLGVAVNNLSIL